MDIGFCFIFNAPGCSSTALHRGRTFCLVSLNNEEVLQAFQTDLSRHVACFHPLRHSLLF